MSLVNDEDRAAALAFRACGFAGWMNGVDTEAHLIEKLAQFAADAREAGIREGVDLAKEHAWVSNHNGWHPITPCIDWEGVDKAIAARRGK